MSLLLLSVSLPSCPDLLAGLREGRGEAWPGVGSSSCGRPALCDVVTPRAGRCSWPPACRSSLLGSLLSPCVSSWPLPSAAARKRSPGIRNLNAVLTPAYSTRRSGDCLETGRTVCTTLAGGSSRAQRGHRRRFRQVTSLAPSGGSRLAQLLWCVLSRCPSFLVQRAPGRVLAFLARVRVSFAATQEAHAATS